MDEACWTELRDLGHEIGLHSHTHPTSMAQLPLDVQRRECAANAECIHRATGTRPTTAAHPCGSYTLQTLDILEELGVELAFAVSGGVRHRPHLEIQRMDSTDALAAARGKSPGTFVRLRSRQTHPQTTAAVRCGRSFHEHPEL